MIAQGVSWRCQKELGENWVIPPMPTRPQRAAREANGRLVCSAKERTLPPHSTHSTKSGRRGGESAVDLGLSPTTEASKGQEVGDKRSFPSPGADWSALPSDPFALVWPIGWIKNG